MIDGIGTIPYSQRLVAERRLRGDLIETFKVVNNIVEYGKSVFKISRSGYNLISKPFRSNANIINKLYI